MHNQQSNPKISRYAEQVVRNAGIIDYEVEQRLLSALSAVQRHLFLPEKYHARAYEDISLPIGFDQTSSRPSTIARMLSILGVAPGYRMLEVGSGSGYTLALAVACGVQVYGIEVQGLLAQQSRKRLDRSGFQKVLLRSGSGLKGWKDQAPYDGILLSMPVDSILEQIVDQLSSNGVCVAPVGDASGQQLTVIKKQSGRAKVFTLEKCQIR